MIRPVRALKHEVQLKMLENRRAIGFTFSIPRGAAMNANTLITQIVSRSDTVQYLWCVLLAVGLAVLIAAAKSQAGHAALPRFLFFGFAFFAITHLMSLHWVTMQWAAAAEALQKSPAWVTGNADVKAALMPVVPAPGLAWVLPFHLVFDVFVLVGVWWMTRK